MILDGILAFAGDDDDVLDPGDHALLSDVLDLRFVYHRKHFLGLRFGGGQEAGAETGGGQHGFAHSAAGKWVH